MTVFPTQRELENKIEDLRAELMRERSQSHRLRLQLAACAAVAHGWHPSMENHPLWSPALHDVIGLRKNFDALRCADAPKKPPVDDSNFCGLGRP